jgi:hypothetical protein
MTIVRSETWTVRGGRLVRLNRAPRGNQQRVTKSGILSVSVHTGGTEVPPLPYPNYTDYPTVNWIDIDTSYPLRNLNSWAELPDMSTILRALPSKVYVKMPDGFRGMWVDFKSGGTQHGILAPNCMGLWGNGPGKAVIRMKPMSSTQVASIPQQSTKGVNPLISMRLGPASPTVNAGVHCYGLAFGGTDQPNQPDTGNGLGAHPHSYHGIRSYWETGATYDWMEIFGIPGDYGAPPGETKAHTFYRGKARNYMRFVNVSGFQERNVGTGGAPTDFTADWGRMCGTGIASFGSEDPYYESVNIEDCYVSGAPDTSSAGDPITGTMTHNATWKNCRSNNNGNHFYPNPGGMNYRAANMEGAYGTILYDRCDFGRMDNQDKLQNAHLFIGNGQVDVPNITVFEPKWDRTTPGSYPTASNGVFIVIMPHTYDGQLNKQVTPPTLIVGGRTLTPVFRDVYLGQGWPSGMNPLTQFCVER